MEEKTKYPNYILFKNKHMLVIMTKPQGICLNANDMMDLKDLNVALGHSYNWPLISMEMLSASVIIAYWSGTIDHNFSSYYVI